MPPEWRGSAEMTALIAVSVFFLREFWLSIKSRGSRLEEEVRKNTLATMELSVELRFLREEFARLAKLPDDVAAAHTKIRSLERSWSEKDQ